MAHSHQPSAPATVAQLGAHPTTDGTWFRTWTPQAKDVQVVLYDESGTETARHPLQARGEGLFEGLVMGVGHGARYKFALDGQAFPDPYARFMPDGVHAPSQVYALDHRWQHEGPGLPLAKMAIYELHVGTFTPEGTFRSAIAQLPALKDLGVTAIEVMPIAAFPGQRGWGYDGVAAFAPYAEYGTPEDVCAFVDAAHGLGLAVILDVVYNHFGPDGNYLYAYSRSYFTRRHMTPWGDAIDYGNPYMRRLILDAAMAWLRDYRFDGLRLDATHHIVDDSRVHLLDELAHEVRRTGLKRVLVAEDDRNEPGLVTAFGLDGVWADDFHHMVRVLLTGERDGYYAAYEPEVAGLARVINRGWLYEGQAWPMSGQRRGASAERLDAPSFVYTIQNHDQIGNRAVGDRLTARVDLDAYLAASTLLLSLPMTPLLFMGQEWAATTPFQYFSDHHGELGKAVSEGRAKEFAHFESFGTVEVPDPQAESTFLASKLNWEERETPEHRRVLDAYRTLLALRREDPVLGLNTRHGLEATAVGDVLWVRRRHGGEVRDVLVNFGEEVSLAALELPLAPTIRFATAEMPAGRLIRHGALILEGHDA